MPHSNSDPSARLEQEFGRILDDSLNEIYIFDAETLKFIRVNRGARENLGYSMEELRQFTPLDIKPEITPAEFQEWIRPLKAGERESVRFDTVHRRKDGSIYTVEVHLQLGTFHDLPAYIAIILDTTDRIRAANELRIRNRAIECAGIGVVITDATQPDIPIIYCNAAFQRITGYSHDEIIGRNCRFLQQGDRDQEARRIIREAIADGSECRTLLRNYRKSGSLFWNDLTISPVKDAGGDVTHFVGLVNDVTNRVRDADILRERGARLRAILDTAVEAIITIDERGVCESINAAGEAMFGYSADEVIGSNVSMLMPSPYREEHATYLADYLKSGERKIIGIGREVVGRRKSGDEFPIHLAVSEVRLEQRRLFTGFIQDVTDRKEAERRLVQNERLAVLGEAMARLAHESRNSLQRIQIAVETARLASENGGPLTEQLTAIEKASDGLDALLEEVRNYAAPLQLNKTECSLPAIWREAWQATSAVRAGRAVKLTESLDNDDLPCRLDRFRLGQVFRNLYENSLAACSDPVEISIRASEQHPSSADGPPHWDVVYCDNGPGMTAEQAARVFEPFYTTRTRGTGLGMAIAHRIMEAHGGSISVTPPRGSGAEFRIRIPQ